ncbi:c-type cytochrome [Spongorhabdus nitratireducens]
MLLLTEVQFVLADENERWGIGQTATPEEIQAWDIAIRPDGKGLPPGTGNVEEGKTLYLQRCALCHGAEGKGGLNDKLVGRLPSGEFPFAEPGAPKKTIGNYWPYATTLFDYIRRTMPYQNPGSLTDSEVYSVTAYLLYLNEIIAADLQLSANNLATIKMPAVVRFVPDDRLQTSNVR